MSIDLSQRHVHSKKASKNIFGGKRSTWLHTYGRKGFSKRKERGILIVKKGREMGEMKVDFLQQIEFLRLIQIRKKKDSEGRLRNEGEEKKEKERGTKV